MPRELTPNIACALSLRVATADDILPVSKPFLGADGCMHNSVSIKEGTVVHVPVEGMNLDQEFWGEDAWKFKCVPDLPNF